MVTGGTYGRIVFCDFDGTITDEESFIGMLKVFAPDALRATGRDMKEMRVTLRDGVRRVVESIPSRLYPDMLEYARTRRRRSGFNEFLDFLDRHGVPLVIISGGLRGLVEANLGPLTVRTGGVYAADVDASGEYLRVTSDHEAGTELVAKARVMDMFMAGTRVAVGDGMTDLVMAQNAQLVFARDFLAAFLEDKKLPYLPWNDFNDIRLRLSAEWGP